MHSTRAAGGHGAFSSISEECETIARHIEEIWPQLPLAADDAVPTLRHLLSNPPDLVTRSLAHGTQLVFVDTIVDTQRLDDAMARFPAGALDQGLAADTKQIWTYGDAVDALLNGDVLELLPAGACRAVSLKAWPQRSPNEPPAEIVTQGPHVGFVENLQTNVALLRHRIRDPRLCWERYRAGVRSDGLMVLVYVRHLANPDVLQRVRDGMRHMHPSFVTDASMLQERFTNVSGLLFPTMDATERPDTAAAGLLEGRIAVLLDGSPVALLAPNVFAHLLQTPEDYYNRAHFAVLRRSLRFGALLAALTFSPLYIALATINQELIPPPIYVSIAQSRLDTPLPLVVELLLMEVVVEMVREAGLRMPSAIGQTISIVGAIVIGQAAVIAGLMSAPVVVVVSLSYIASTVVPSIDTRLALRGLRFPLIGLAAVLGIFGLIWGLMILFLYLVALESFGVPYLAPVAPRRSRGLQDTIWRRPLTDLRAGFAARRAKG